MAGYAQKKPKQFISLFSDQFPAGMHPRFAVEEQKEENKQKTHKPRRGKRIGYNLLIS